MPHYWTRESYDASRNKPTEYPIRNPGVATELRSRGLDVDVPHLQYCIGKGIFTPEGGGVRGSRYLWSAELIDQAAEHFASIGQFTPQAQTCLLLNLDYGQFEEALREAGKHVGGTADPTDFQIVIHPAKAGDAHGRIEFLPAGKGGK